MGACQARGVIGVPGPRHCTPSVERCIAYAREQHAQRVFLVSNSPLQAALRLYESAGFKYCAVSEVKEYENQDVYMELRLDIAEPAA